MIFVNSRGRSLIRERYRILPNEYALLILPSVPKRIMVSPMFRCVVIRKIGRVIQIVNNCPFTVDVEISVVL